MPSCLRLADCGMAAKRSAFSASPNRPLDFELLQFGDRALEQMAEHVEIDFVGEVVAADRS